MRDGTSVSWAYVAPGANLQSVEVALEALLSDVRGKSSVALTFPLFCSLDPLDGVKGDGEFYLLTTKLALPTTYF